MHFSINIKLKFFGLYLKLLQTLSKVFFSYIHFHSHTTPTTRTGGRRLGNF
jgi:hypothetical protein